MVVLLRPLRPRLPLQPSSDFVRPNLICGPCPELLAEFVQDMPLHAQILCPAVRIRLGPEKFVPHVVEGALAPCWPGMLDEVLHRLPKRCAEGFQELRAVERIHPEPVWNRQPRRSFIRPSRLQLICLRFRLTLGLEEVPLTPAIDPCIHEPGPCPVIVLRLTDARPLPFRLARLPLSCLIACRFHGSKIWQFFGSC